MEFGADAKEDLAGIGLVRFLAEFGAAFQIVVNRFVKSGFQFGDRRAMKTDNIANPDNVADKNMIFGVKLDAGGVSIVRYGVHGFTFSSARNFRASLIL